MNVVVIGSCIVDVALYAHRFPVPGSAIAATSVDTAIGGKASNQAIAVTRLGARAHLLTRVGRDNWGELAQHLWQAEDVDVTHVVHDDSAPTGLGVVLVGENGESATVSGIGAAGRLSREDVDAADSTIAAADVVLLHLNAPVDVLRAAMEIARGAGARTILNASPVHTASDVSNLLELADVVIVNRLEAEILTETRIGDREAAPSAAQRLRTLGGRTAMVTLGEEGVAVATPDWAGMIASQRVDAVDATGAGDAFCAGVAIAVAEGRDLVAAARFGCVTGAICVTRRGTWSAMPTRDETHRLTS